MRIPRVIGASNVVVLAGVLLVCPSFGQGAKPGENLFPTGEGSTWEFAGTAGDKAINMTATIISSKKERGAVTVAIRWTMGGQVTQEEHYVVSKDQVARSKSGKDGSNAISPPIPVIKYPMEVGKSWKWDGTIDVGQISLAANSELKVTAREKVKTEAGTFNAYRVDMVLTVKQGDTSQTIPNSYWFAPGAGLVKQQSELKVGNRVIVIQAAVNKMSVK